jgi:GNAT superfamily N-acetyltransferase
MDLPLIIRPFEEKDRAFIEGTWKRIVLSQPQYRWLKNIRLQSVGYVWLNKLIPLVIESSTLTVAANPEDSEHILGWACTKPPLIVHCLFVRPRYRRLGIARRLLRDAKLCNCVESSLWHKLMLRKRPKYRYNPLLYQEILHEALEGDYNAIRSTNTDMQQD